MKKCAFCDRPENEVRHLLGSDNTHICSNCLTAAYNVYTMKEGLQRSPSKKKRDASESGEHLALTPRILLDHLGAHVVAQQQAKMDFAVALYDHWVRVKAAAAGEHSIQKSNMLVLGPSGSGKTELARAAAKLLRVPFYVADATRFTQAGYVGDDVDSVIEGLLADCDGDPELAAQGIVVIDEIDKLARKSGRGVSGQRDVTGEGVQQALLKMVEGTTIRRGQTEVSTHNILFIGTGSFAGIEECVMRRKGKNVGVGFGREAKQTVTNKDAYSQYEEVDLLEFGMIPELVGRFPVLTSTLPLLQEDMLRILTEPKNAVIHQMVKLWAQDNIELVFTPEFLSAVAAQAMKHETGARALRGIVEKALRPWRLIYAGNSVVKKLVVTEACLTGEEPQVTYNSPVQAVKAAG